MPSSFFFFSSFSRQSLSSILLGHEGSVLSSSREDDRGRMDDEDGEVEVKDVFILDFLDSV